MTRPSASHLFQRYLDEQSDEAWSQFQERHMPYVKGVIRRAVRRFGIRLREPQIEDLLQELFCRLLHLRPRFGGSDRKLWCYLSQMTLHLLVDRYRRTVFQRKRLSLVRHGLGAEWLHTELSSEEILTPEDIAMRRDGWRQLCSLAARVVRPDRRSLELRALRLALLEGYSSREVSQACEGLLTPQRVDRLVFRLRRKLLAAGLGVLPRRFTSRHRLKNSRSPKRSGLCSESTYGRMT